MRNPLKPIFKYLTVTTGQGNFLFFLCAVGMGLLFWGLCGLESWSFLFPSSGELESFLSFRWISSSRNLSLIGGLAILLLAFVLYLGMTRESERRGFLIGLSFSLLVHAILWMSFGGLIVGNKPVREREAVLNLQPKAPIIVNDYYFGDLPYDEVFKTFPQPGESEGGASERDSENGQVGVAGNEGGSGEENASASPWRTETEIIQAPADTIQNELAQAEDFHDSLEEETGADGGAVSENARLKAEAFEEAKLVEAEMEKGDFRSQTPSAFVDLEKKSQKISASGLMGAENLSADPLAGNPAVRSDVPLPEKLNMRREALKKLEGESEFSKKLKSERAKRRNDGEENAPTMGTLPSQMTRDGENVVSGQAQRWGETPTAEQSGVADGALGEIRSGLGETQGPAASAASLKVKKGERRDASRKIAVSDAPEKISGGQTVGAKAGDGERLEAVLAGAVNGVSDAVLETTSVPDKFSGSNILDQEKEERLKNLVVFQFETPSVPEMGMNPKMMKAKALEASRVWEAEAQEDENLHAGPEIDLASPIQEIIESGRAFQPQASLPYRQRKRQNHRKMIEEAGGNPISEQVVENGLQYLERTQFPDGRWSLNTVPSADKLEEESLRKAGFGVIHADTAATGLSLLAFLGAGYTHLEKESKSDYAETIEKGLSWLLRNQQDDGSLFQPRTDADRYGRIYSHGIATIALCEAYGMTHDPRLHGPAQRAVDFIVNAQTPLGGWRYTPEKNDGVWRGESDTSVSGWQAMALVSAKMAGLNAPDSAFEKLEQWLLRAAVEGGAKFCYLPVDNPKNEEMEKWKKPSYAMSAEGLLMKLYLAHDKKEENFQKGVDYLMENLPSVTGARRDAYYWYYATQVLFHVHDARWMEWQKNLVSALRKSQEMENPALRGSWDPVTPAPDYWGQAAGRHYVTAIHLLILEVYYRHLPLFKELVPENVAGI